MRVLLLLLLPALGGQDDAEALVRKLGSDKVEERDEAIRGLKAMGRAALPAIEKAAADKDAEIAARARDLLRRLAIRESFSPRLKALLPGIEDRLDPDKPSLWTEALLKLTARREGKLVHPEIRAEDLDLLAARALRGAGDDRSLVVREIRRWGLRSAASELVPLLAQGDFHEHFWASQTLRGLEAREFAPQIEALLRSPNSLVRGTAMAILADWNVRESIPALLQLVEGSEPADRSGAVTTLIRLRARELIPEVVGRLDDCPPDMFQDLVRLVTAFRATEAVPVLLKKIESKDPAIRRAALGVFSILKAPEAVPILGPLLEHEDEFTRYPAQQTLEAMRTLPAAEAIVRHGLRSNKPALRSSAFTALCNLGFRETIPEIVRALRDENAQVREGALFTLDYLDAREAIPDLLRLVEEETNTTTLQKAVACLEVLRAKEAVPVLRKLLERPEPGFRPVAVHALGELGDRSLAPIMLKAMEDPWTRMTAARAAARLRLEEAVPRIRAILAEEKNLHSRVVLAECLRDLGDLEAVPALLKSLAEKDRIALSRSSLQRVLWNDRSLIPRYLADLKDPARQTDAVNRLRELQATEATPGLKALLEDPDKQVRGHAVSVLGCGRDRDVIPDIVKHLRDPEYYVRMMTLMALDNLDARSAVPDLLKQVEEDEELGTNAADLLAKWEVADVLPAIERRILGGYAFPRAHVTALRFHFGDRRVLPEVVQGIETGESWVAHRMIFLAVSKNVTEAIPAILTRLHDPDDKLQQAAAAALIRMGRHEAIDPILDRHVGMNQLNALHRPEEFRRLDGATVKGSRSGSAKEIAERIAKEAELTLEGPAGPWADDPAWDRSFHHFANVGDRMTRLQMLCAVVSYRYEVICEPSTIRIVRRSEALPFWRAWRAKQLKK